MSQKDDRKKEDPVIERIARLEVIVENHDVRLEKLENAISEIKESLHEVLSTQKGLNFFLKNILLPIILAIITAIVIRII